MGIRLHTKFSVGVTLSGSGGKGSLFPLQEQGIRTNDKSIIKAGKEPGLLFLKTIYTQ